MKALAPILLSVSAFAAVNGTVTNTTTGKPQGGVIIQMVQPGQGGMQTLGTSKSAPDGTTPGHRGNCPNDGPGSGSDGSGGSNSSPDASPDASNSDV